MNNIYLFIIFVVFFFFYFHVVKQYETSEDLEIYEMDYLDNTNLQETCDIKQPVVFRRDPINLPDIVSSKQLLNLKDANDYKQPFPVDSIELPCESMIQLFLSDTASHYFTENNQTFINETALYKVFIDLDYELKPKLLTMSKNYDIMMGSQGTCTPLRYHKNSRKFLYLAKGVQVP